ncbi:hypothetical protein E1A91_A05G296500v1 [Gossypium mustelinum]|uniref:Uncharacterized protein n=3 Tax=Gossypium TaxID=3633 RepID=A0A5J5VVT1_GOSBA|nr:hypothetical protein ES319_A05G289000v1 [Gossypium barbadense]KAB2083739.1 hypothetical protein ES319_A05G289000v1 [Gossypium barbadense]TYH18790.1 hypothetical protein ES288_A05G301600v1 [Gossypium darwinii]TYJ36269.1 hypothetical protein E1A91_A05G296500v1 [Gossypium mustelinum]TYJ36270.1 hypothetical protein E1A91_A05G296500v1 [Gossypium mustelinum]
MSLELDCAICSQPCVFVPKIYTCIFGQTLYSLVHVLSCVCFKVCFSGIGFGFKVSEGHRKNLFDYKSCRNIRLLRLVYVCFKYRFNIKIYLWGFWFPRRLSTFRTHFSFLFTATESAH